MKKKLKEIVIVVLLICIGLASLIIYIELSGFVGGPCSYDTYNGIVTITSVKLVENLMDDIEQVSVRYEVLFIFELNENESIKQEHISLYETISGKKHEFRLMNSWYPNKDYLEKYNIKENETFECKLKLITEGTCTPWIYDLNNINETDYTTFDLNGER